MSRSNQHKKRSDDGAGRHVSKLWGTLLAIVTAVLVAPAAAHAAVEWDSELYYAPTHLEPGSTGVIVIYPVNAGSDPSPEFPTVSFDLPVGLTIESVVGLGWNCSGSPTTTCTNPFGAFVGGTQAFAYPALGGANTVPVQVEVGVEPSAPEGPAALPVTVSGLGGADSTHQYEVTIDSESVPFGPLAETATAGAYDEAGAAVTQAGAHPYKLTTFFEYATDVRIGNNGSRLITPAGAPRDVVAEIPPGVMVDPSGTPKCSGLGDVTRETCSASSQVGVVNVSPPIQTGGTHRSYGIYNVEPPSNLPAQLAFQSPVGVVVVNPSLRDDGSFGLNATVRNLTQIDVLYQSEVVIWGVPADPSHDAQRCSEPNYIAQACVGATESGDSTIPGGQPADIYEPHSSSAPLRPLASNPTRCNGTSDVTRLHASSWEEPASFQPDGDPDLSDPDWATVNPQSPALTNCEALDFAPGLIARPTTDTADSPTGLEVKLSVPQNEDPEGLATAHLKDAVVTLPEGLVVNPSSANGLGACSPAQVGLSSPIGNGDPVFDKLQAECPDASKIGTVAVDTPLLEDPLQGAVYVGTPYENPFNSLLSIYIVVEGPGLIVKLAGEVTPDPQTGRLTAVVKDNPQVPFNDFKLNFFGGAAASLKTPATCGTYSTTSSLTPWSAPQSGPPATPSDTYGISQAPGGGACATSPAGLPNTPAFEAGATSPLAGNYSPFVLNLRREDGSQQFSSVTLTPPQGLVAKLAGTPACSDAALAAAATTTGKAEQAAPSCPAASEVGNVIAGAGAGPAPYYAPGKAYLAGPYKGAPLSLAIITPAVAGPFDLGTIVVRTALHLDSKTAQITAVSDPIPTILKGIPLDVRSVQVRIDKPQFTLNPTTCDPSAVTGSLISTTGATAALNNRFQLAECGRLGFKPKMTLSLKGAIKRSKFPALTATLTPRAGDANIRSVSVAFPPSEFLAQSHIRTVCTRVQFAADQCPAASVYGTATVTTPLLDYPLTGPVYLRSSSNELPDLVPDLRGPALQPIKLEAAGRTDSVDGGIRNTFDYVPDAPFTKLVLKMQGGKKGLLENSRDICAQPYRATVKYGAHNGQSFEAKPKLVAQCGKARKGKKSKGRSGAKGDGKR